MTEQEEGQPKPGDVDSSGNWYLGDDNKWYPVTAAPPPGPGVQYPTPTYAAPKSGMSTGGKIAITAAIVVGTLVLLTIVGLIVNDGANYGSGSTGDTDAISQYKSLIDRFGVVFTEAADNPAGWETYCDQMASMAREGLALPDGPSSEFDVAWDGAMNSLSRAGDGTITGCIGAMNAATPQLDSAAAALTNG